MIADCRYTSLDSDSQSLHLWFSGLFGTHVKWLQKKVGKMLSRDRAFNRSWSRLQTPLDTSRKIGNWSMAGYDNRCSWAQRSVFCGQDGRIKGRNGITSRSSGATHTAHKRRMLGGAGAGERWTLTVSAHWKISAWVPHDRHHRVWNKSRNASIKEWKKRIYFTERHQQAKKGLRSKIGIRFKKGTNAIYSHTATRLHIAT